jgi:RND family efflux transporter MFP subunit
MRNGKRRTENGERRTENGEREISAELVATFARHHPSAFSVFRFPLSGLAILSFLLLPACSKKGGGEDEVKAPEVPTIAAEVAKVTRQPITRTLIVRGTVAAAPNEDVKISALVAGRVVAMYVAEGDTVRKGQVLAEIERRPLEDQRRQASAALDQAKAAFENARLHSDRTEKLFKQGIAAGKEVEDARSQLAAAQAGVEQASAALDIADRQIERANVASPIAGQVVKRLVSVGEQVDGTAGQPIVEVANLDVVELAANIPAEYLAAVRVGLPVSIVCGTFPGRTFDGRVIAIAPAVDPASNSALGRIRIPNAGHLLKVGMFAEGHVPVEEHKNALVVPASAVARDQASTAVYVLNGDIAERKPVTLGIETPDAVEVLSGVNEGQTVLTSNIHGLGEKAKLVKGS